MRRAGWLLISGLWFLTGCGFDERVPIDMTSLSQSQPLGKEKFLNSVIDFDIGSLEITGSTNGETLYNLDLEYDKASFSPRISYNPADEGKFSFDLDSTRTLGIRRERHNNRLRLAFNDTIPVKLRVNAGVGDARLSLSGMSIAGIEFEAGVGGAKISAYEPNRVSCEYLRIRNGVGSIEGTGLGNLNFRNFDFEGGVGGANLDFTGEWKQDADIRIQVGVGGVSVRMPRNIGVRLETERNFLSGLHLEGFTLRDDHYYSDNYDEADVKTVIRVETGVGGFRITWI